MATTIWEPSESPVGRSRDAVVSAARGEGGRLQKMGIVRRFVSEVLRGEGGSELSDAEWASLCEVEQHSGSDCEAIASLVLRAYALRESTIQTPRPLAAPAMSLAPPAVAAVEEVPPDRGPDDFPPITPVIQANDPLPIPAGLALATVAEPEPEGWIPALEFHPPEPAGVATDSQFLPALTFTAWPLEVDSPPSVHPPEALAPIERPRRSRKRQTRGNRPRTSAEGELTTGRREGSTQADPRSERRRDRLLVATSWVRNFGIIILLFVSWQLWGTAITQHQSQDTLKQQFDARVHHAAVKPKPGFTLIPAATRIPDPPQGTVMAHLVIPKIGLDEFVVSGTNEGDLAKGPGHYLGTAMPGQAGNVAIAGHRTTHGAPFNHLAELAIGDPIYLTTSTGQQLTYIVSAVPVPVSPKDVTVLNNFGDNRLTLTTCNPEYSAIQRLIVVAAYLPPGATHPALIVKGSGTPYALAPATISGWNTTLLPLVLVELGALIGLGLAFGKLSKVYGRAGRWLILGPIWLALLLALFETLVNFLPASI